MPPDPAFRAIVIAESLQDGWPPSFLADGDDVHAYRHMLDETTEITILERAVAPAEVLGTAMALARILLPRLYYAHLISEAEMYVAFPSCVVHLARDDVEGERQAVAIGQMFDIPRSQMRFLEMFDTDHPDAVELTHS